MISSVLSALFLIGCSGLALAHNHEGSDEAIHTTPQTNSLFNISDTWTTSQNKPFRLKELSGKPTVITMVYTSCQMVCPVVVENVKKVEKSLPSNDEGKVNFAVFSFDPDRDTAEQLKTFAKDHKIESPAWTLAYGNAAAVRKLAVALGIKYKKTKSGDFEHDTIITILDGEGVIKYQQNALGKTTEGASLMLRKMLGQ